MKSTNTQNNKILRSNFELGTLTKRDNWNSKRRYSFLTQYKFI